MCLGYIYTNLVEYTIDYEGPIRFNLRYILKVFVIVLHMIYPHISEKLELYSRVINTWFGVRGGIGASLYYRWDLFAVQGAETLGRRSFP